MKLRFVIPIILSCTLIGCDNNQNNIVKQDSKTETKQEVKKTKEDINKELEFAVATSDLESCKKAIENGADVNYIGNRGIVVLSDAIVNANKDIINLLVENGADKSKIDVSKIKKGSWEYIKLQGYGIDVSKAYVDPEFEKISKKVDEEMKQKELKEKSKNPVINGFEILEQKGEGNYITGKIKNTNAVSYSSVFININLIDNKDGSILESTIDSINNLQAGQVWNFKAPVTVNKACKFRIMDIKGYK